MDKFHKNISHTKCNTFPDTKDGFDYFEAINELYGMTGEKIYKYMELDFEKSVLTQKDNFEYKDTLEYNVWKNKDESSSIGARIALTLPEVDNGVRYANFKLTLCYLSNAFMIDIDLPKLRKSWYKDPVVKTKAIRRLFEHNLITQSQDEIKKEFENVSTTYMKTVKGVHIIGYLDNIKYPLSNIKLLEILKKYTDSSYMIKSLKDPSRGFCDKIAEIHSIGGFRHDPEWVITNHLNQAQRIDMIYMNNNTPANRIALFRRVLAVNLDFYDPGDRVANRNEDATNYAKNKAIRQLVLVLQSCVINTESSGPTKYSINNNEECKSYFIQTMGCEQDKRTEEQKILDGDPLNNGNMKVNTKYSAPKEFKDFEVVEITSESENQPETNGDNRHVRIFELFKQLLDDCWEYSGKEDRTGGYIFNEDLLDLLDDIDDLLAGINMDNFFFSDRQTADLLREHTKYNETHDDIEAVCKSLDKPGPYGEDRIAKNVENKMGIPGFRGSLLEMAAAHIPNEDFKKELQIPNVDPEKEPEIIGFEMPPPPDRLNLTDDPGPLVYQQSRTTIRNIPISRRLFEDIEITETL